MNRYKHLVSSSKDHIALFTNDSEQELLKAKLTVQIYLLIKRRGLAQTEAAKILGTTQPQISALMRCRPVSISVGRLMEFITILGQDIEVKIKPANQGKGYIDVSADPETVLCKLKRP